ncbi:DeoR/GlpR family DNA-binding transcription regulator [Paraburkholderia caballeronis]|uniref:DNA-binding transcriptional regulator of sugar metabolism, DeoR/GlpR family n=1 Tax=Paraburkholderia caballeronis TaxID=416943 RepID=A0A1H7W9R5_9BURK|nr:DeoR/GlpR family DNA-binding transcription regulator [Paraburkholderia caballeronis]PXW13763.1 DeoR family transcriptional regulator [Paraburkholderia caballeronis]PXW92742.1 DeoR family transcriptional regulator [Paraburkholderia caballeronis]RAJ86600.1 DeoR family transcriptional regulator [Paraburkholderia caballeronis]TDV01701.1 DeoR family transcriptional regulator [Paraburkholderia caballeronis]TDV06301.1 DeoR family transcriptional regulator [Paraburkholderia caballeronis]
MKASDRHRAILDLVLMRDANVEQLSSALGVSEATIRRDLAQLAKERRLVRTYGGATARVGTHEPEASLEERKATQREQKEAIAHAAAAHVADGDTVFLDGGTTCAALARHLAARQQELHVVTNNLLAVMTLANAPGVQLTLIGGDVRSSSMSTLGPLAELTLSRLSVDRAFLGADGVVAGFGLCEASAQQAWLKECIVSRAADVVVLADTEKLGRARQQYWTPLQRPWRLITSSLAGETLLQPFREAADIALEVAPCGPSDANAGAADDLPSFAG